MIFKDKKLQEQAEKDGIKTWEDLRDYLVDCGCHDLDDFCMDDFDDIMSDESLGARYAIQYRANNFSLNDDFFYFDDWGYINSEKVEDYQQRLLDAYAETIEE